MEAVYIPYIMAAVAAAGAVYQGVQTRNANMAAAEQADVNAKAARQGSNAREEIMRRQLAGRLAEQRASAAQSGFNPNAGSFVDLQGQSASNAELDALTTRYEGEMQALSLDSEASGLRARGRSATRQGYVNAAGSLMSGYAYGSGLKIPSGSSYNYNGDASGSMYSATGADIRGRR